MAYNGKPNSNSMPFRFTSSGYTPPGHDSVAFDFSIPKSSQTGNLKAAINVMKANYQDETYTYVKECKKFIIGYNVYGVQIIKGKCTYGGIRDLGAFIVGFDFLQGEKDLIGIIKGMLRGPDQNLPAYVKVFQQGQKDLPGFLRGLLTNDLPATLYPVPPKNLPAYLKVWPQNDLPGNIHGWEERDLGGSIYSYQFKDLPARIFAEGPRNLGARLKGWAREVVADLGGIVRGLTYEQLQAIIRATYLKDLPAYIGAVAPRDLNGNIYGWDELDLSATLNGVYGDYDLQAYINITGNYKDLIGRIKPIRGKEIVGNLPASLYGFQAGNLGGTMNIIDGANLPAYIESNLDKGDLGAIITPKIIRLTGLISYISMEHKNMSAVINALCFGSESRNLNAYLRPTHRSDLSAYIMGYYAIGRYRDLGATINQDSTYLTLDKLPISITLNNNKYRAMDKLVLNFHVYKMLASLGASITGILTSKNLGASITASYLDPYNFENPKYKEIVRELRYNNIEKSLQFVELSFRSIVEDMFYVSGTQEVVKEDRLDKWVLDVRSFLPADSKVRIKRRFKRFKYIHSLEDFATLDEAIKNAIAFVTDNPVRYLNAYINATGQFNNLTSSISGWYRNRSNLNTQITGIP